MMHAARLLIPAVYHLLLRPASLLFALHIFSFFMAIILGGCLWGVGGGCIMAIRGGVQVIIAMTCRGGRRARQGAESVV